MVKGMGRRAKKKVGGERGGKVEGRAEGRDRDHDIDLGRTHGWILEEKIIFD